MEMSIRLYLINIDKQTYNIVESVNITEHLKLLKKYSPFLIQHTKCYQQYNIRNDFKQIKSIDTDEKYSFIDLIDTEFGKEKIKPNWYQFQPDTLEKLEQFISTFLPPLSGTQITPEANYKCTKCGKIYRDKRCFNKHITDCLNDTSYQCQTCGVKYKSHTRYYNHTLKCKSLICEICNKKFSTKQMLDKHIERGCGTFPCKNCGKTFLSRYKIEQHCQQKHGFTPLI